MSHNTMSLSEMEMEALIKYGESLTQFDNNEERTECFLKGWRGAFEDPADRARWTQMFPLSAMNALWSRGYLGFAQDTYDQEHRLLFDEIMKLVLDSGADVPAELREAWAKAKRQWGGYYYPTNNLLPAYFTGLYATPSPSPERLVAEAVKEKKKAGRPPGSKDSGPRAPKYTYSNISGAERQRIYRKQRKALLKQQQQQQQQTPPSE